jgi:dihydroxyacetone kinase-like protein
VSAEVIPANIGHAVLVRLAADVDASAAWLSELDGASGDGDHGVNMRTGMRLADERVEPGSSVSDALRKVGDTLLEDIGGAMGPLYGVFFLALADASAGREWIDAECALTMLSDGAAAVIDLGGAEVGDKTLIDVLVPTVGAFREALASGEGLAAALGTAADAAGRRRDATKYMVARIGRAARAGERSRGHIDAGAASCALILGAICSVFAENVQSEAIAS